MNKSDANSMKGHSAWPDRVAQWLIRRAAHSGPTSLAERLHEEWAADLATRSSAIYRLRFALGCCWATQVIAFQYRPARVAAGASSLPPKGVITAGFVEPGFFARRSSTLMVVICLHIALAYAFVSGLRSHVSHLIPPPLEYRPLQDLNPRAPPPPPPALFQPKTIPYSVPDFPLTNTNENPEAPIQPRDAEQLPPPPTPAHVPSRTQGGPGAGFPSSDEYYPQVAKLMEEHGAVTVSVCVDTNGRLTASPTLVQTSGSLRLDGGALLLAKVGSGRYRPTTEDGRAVNSCYQFRVRFELRK